MARLPGDWAFPITNVALYRFDDWVLSDGQMLDRSCLGTPPMVRTQIAMHQNRVAVNSERGDLTWGNNLLERITSTQMMKAVSPQRRTISKCDRPSGLTINAPANHMAEKWCGQTPLVAPNKIQMQQMRGLWPG